MKISLNWLKEFVDIDMSQEELSHLLTMIGIEVASVMPVACDLDAIIAARILDIKPHPNADCLSLCTIDTGEKQIPVVCGAPNIKKGDIVPLALPGVRLPNGTKIKKGKIRGEVSEGVLLAEDELGLTDDHSGIMILPDASEPGMPITKIISLEDSVLDLELTPNRPDCASVIGIAREIAAATGKTLKRPEPEVNETGPNIEDLTSVTILEREACPRYTAGVVQHIKIGTSPFWMRYRLHLSGIRPVNNIVDVTNYVMLEMGQPLHAFDYDRLEENRIVVKFARQDESFTTLDGQTHNLDQNTLVICDAKQPVALAGIMGGLNSEIYEDTSNILIESAYFDPVIIRRASKRLGISTEASYRFERGADIEGTHIALKRALELISTLAGGSISKGIIDNYPKPYIARPVTLRIDRTNRILGSDLSRETIEGYLKGLNMDVERPDDQNTLVVTPPSFRVDISREADLFEEVARLEGYENIPITIPRIQPATKTDSQEISFGDHIRSVMRGAGFCEVITYSFISPASADMLDIPDSSPLRSFVKILNPLSLDQSVMRTNLIHGLLTVAESNIHRGAAGLKFFELGKVFFHREDNKQPIERMILTAIITGPYQEKTWYCQERMVDFYDIKGALEVFFEGVGIEDFSLAKTDTIPWFDTNISANVSSTGRVVGNIGRLKPDVVKAYNLKNKDFYAFEVDIEALLACIDKNKQFKPFPRFPAVYRDISILVPKGIESAAIVNIIKQHGKDLVESIRIFDLYEGEKIDKAEKAIAFRICYRSKKGTLEGEKINKLHETIIDIIRQETGGKLREG